MRNNKFLLLFFCLLLIGSTCFTYADDTDDSITIPDNIDTPSPVVVDLTQLVNSLTDQSKDAESDPEPLEVINLEPQLVEMTQTKQVVTPSDASGFKAVLLTIVGDYETVVTDYTYQQNNYQYLSHSIQIERDYAWICSAAMLGLIVYCTFRIIGGMLCKR